MRKHQYPSDDTIGFECMYWRIDNGCSYPKFEIEGRRSCEGVIDSHCVYVIKGASRLAVSEAVSKPRLKPPYPGIGAEIPPGSIGSEFDEL